MKNIKYMFITILCLFINVFYVNASCTDEQINELKLKAKDIKITYKHMGIIEKEDEIYYNNFEVKAKNVDNDLYFSLINGTIILEPKNSEVVYVFSNGKWNFDVYSKSCEQKIHSIEVNIPKFNRYSLDPLCEGIDGEEFSLCGKYYDYDVPYKSFVERINHYRITHNIKNNQNVEDKNNDDKFIVLYKNIFRFVKEYSLYMGISFSVVLIITVFIIVIIKRRKRGVLK